MGGLGMGAIMFAASYILGIIAFPTTRIVTQDTTKQITDTIIGLSAYVGFSAVPTTFVLANFVYLITKGYKKGSWMHEYEN